MYMQKSTAKTRLVFVKHGCPRWQQSQIMAKISKSYILTPPHPQGHGMSVKCEEPLNELTVQVWLLYHHPNFNYRTLFVSGTELRTDGQTDKQTIWLLDAPGGPFMPGHNNNWLVFHMQVASAKSKSDEGNKGYFMNSIWMVLFVWLDDRIEEQIIQLIHVNYESPIYHISYQG